MRAAKGRRGGAGDAASAGEEHAVAVHHLVASKTYQRDADGVGLPFASHWHGI